MNISELAAVIKAALEEEPGLNWANPDQSYWDEQNGHLHTGVEGLVDCTVIAEKVIAAMKTTTKK